MKIIIKNGIVVAQSEIAEIVSNGIRLDDYIFAVAVNEHGQFTEPMPDIVTIDTDALPSDYAPGKYCYTDGKFTMNPAYVPYISPEQEIAQLKTNQQLMQRALDELILNGGVV